MEIINKKEPATTTGIPENTKNAVKSINFKKKVIVINWIL
jgi:hypothetical protein